MACSICFSAIVPTQKAYANPLVLTNPQVIVALLGLCGIGITAANSEELVAVGQDMLNSFETYVENKYSMSKTAVAILLAQAQTGLVNLQGTAKEGWQIFKEWVTSLYIAGLAVGSTRPDITSWCTDDDFVMKYYDKETYPYYYYDTNKPDIDTVEGTKATRSAVIFETCPILVCKNTGSMIYLDAYRGSDDYLLNGYKHERKYYNSTGDTNSFVDKINVGLFTSNVTEEEFIRRINTNIPIFNSKEEGQAWYDANVKNGLFDGPDVLPVFEIPNNNADVHVNEYGALDGYDVIGAGSYVDEDGKVISADVRLPQWQTMVGVGSGTATWQDVVGSNTVIDTTVDGTLENALEGVQTAEDGTVVKGQPLVDKLGKTNYKFMLSDLKKLFPFCIPFDLIDFLKLFASEKAEAPCFKATLKVPHPTDDGYLYKHTFKLDMSEFDSIAKIFRSCILILFLVGLAGATRGLIRG